MLTTPKSLRLQIGLFGRTNVGKSSFLNLVAGQDVAITSAVPGTTTDVVEKAMELLPIGPVVFLDTGGVDDISALSTERIKKTKQIFDRADVFVLLVEPEHWSEFETAILDAADKRGIPCLVVVNKIDISAPSASFLDRIQSKTSNVLLVSSINGHNRDGYVTEFKRQLLEVVPEDFLHSPPLIGDLVPPGGLAVLVVPIDLQAPKGRLILPQVQTIRDALDNDAAVIMVKEREYPHLLTLLNRPPDIVICDSQVVLKMVADTPKRVHCTTFSILFARFKGDLNETARGAAAVERLKKGDRVLIAEACSHHAAADDIGRVKVPRWLRQYTGTDLAIDIFSGRDYPDNLADYQIVVHCGACMLTRREMLFRIHRAKQAGVAITNYGVCISFLQGVIKRVLSPFPSALDAYEQEIARF